MLYLQKDENNNGKKKIEEIYNNYRRLMYFIGPVDSPKTKSYVAIITEHKAIDIVRAKKKFVEWDDSIPGVEIDPPGDLGLADAIAALPGRYRELLLLRYDNGYDTMEIAKMLNMKRGTVQKMIWRAKEMLSKKMEA